MTSMRAQGPRHPKHAVTVARKNPIQKLIAEESWAVECKNSTRRVATFQHKFVTFKIGIQPDSILHTELFETQTPLWLSGLNNPTWQSDKGDKGRQSDLTPPQANSTRPNQPQPTAPTKKRPTKKLKTKELPPKRKGRNHSPRVETTYLQVSSFVSQPTGAGMYNFCTAAAVRHKRDTRAPGV